MRKIIVRGYDHGWMSIKRIWANIIYKNIIMMQIMTKKP